MAMEQKPRNAATELLRRGAQNAPVEVLRMRRSYCLQAVAGNLTFPYYWTFHRKPSAENDQAKQNLPVSMTSPRSAHLSAED